MLQFSGFSCMSQNQICDYNFSRFDRKRIRIQMVTTSYIHLDTSILVSNVHSKIELVAKLATPAAYRIMQRSSSCKEPRHPLPKVLFVSSVMFV